MSDIEEKIDFEAVRIGALAKRMAAEKGYSRLVPEIYAVALLTKAPNSATRIIETVGGNLADVLNRCRKVMEDRCKVFQVAPGQYNNIAIDESCGHMSRSAEEYRSSSSAQRIGLIHMLLGILKTNKEVTAAFVAGGVSLTGLEGVIRSATVANTRNMEAQQKQLEAPAAPKVDRKVHPGDNPLGEFCTDLTMMAAQGKLDPTVGRDFEINRMIVTLCRKKKNCPLLIGEYGVGKTAAVEGLAQRIVSGNVPLEVVGKKIYALNMAAVVAGTRYRGQFEEQMQRLLEAMKRDPDAILFVDEAHILVGAGSAEGSMDASNILKPALARGGFRCIAATTDGDYKKYFRRDKALDRRFQRVPIDEPTAKQTLEILHGLKDSYEKHHNCSYAEEALEGCVEFAGRHISDRFFPDKAIDVMDEMGARNAGSTDRLMRVHAAKAVADQIGAPLETVLPTDSQRESLVRDELKKLVVGQDAAIETVSRAVRRAFSPLRDPLRPLASFVFGGPTSVGKSYMAKILARQLYVKAPLIRINMAEYTEKHTVSRLIGSPPGYVGFGDRNQLTDRVHKHPHSAVLFDNIDKAHQEVLDVIMEMMEAGYLTDGDGQDVNFCSTTIIMTTTAGSVHSAKGSLGFSGGATSEADEARQRLIKACTELFGDEFVSRVDEFVPFLSLGKKELRKVADYALSEVAERLRPSGVELSPTVKMVEHLAEESENARSVRSLIKSQIEPMICDVLAQSDFKLLKLSWDGEYKAQGVRAVV